jgi:hypothetical protein
VPDWVEVGCYAGGRGEETPRVVMLRVERRWIEEPDGSWTLAHAADGR